MTAAATTPTPREGVGVLSSVCALGGPRRTMATDPGPTVPPRFPQDTISAQTLSNPVSQKVGALHPQTLIFCCSNRIEECLYMWNLNLLATPRGPTYAIIAQKPWFSPVNVTVYVQSTLQSTLNYIGAEQSTLN